MTPGRQQTDEAHVPPRVSSKVLTAIIRSLPQQVRQFATRRATEGDRSCVLSADERSCRDPVGSKGRTFRRESAPMERFITGRDRQSAAAGSDLDAVGERELGVAAADVPD